MVEILKRFFIALFLSGTAVFLLPKWAKATPGNEFPPYLQNTLVVRITGCMLDWLQTQLDYIFQDDGVAGSGDELCPAGQHTGGGSFSAGSVPCGWKTLNFINALLMDLLDQNDTTDVLCCCDPSKDDTACTGGASASCPAQFPNTGKCMDLKPEATNYFVVSGFEAWKPVSVDTSVNPVTEAWKGLLDQCLPIPLMGDLCINLSLNDVCNGPNCGPPQGYNGSTNPGNCAYYPYDTATDQSGTECYGIYRSQNRDYFILFYDPVGGVDINFDVGESTDSCGMGPANYNYNGKVFTGNEGYLTIELNLGTSTKPIRIDIDAATPSKGSQLDFPVQSSPKRATRVAPGENDCDPDRSLHQGDCYVRAYLQAVGALKVRLGATVYLEHRTDQTPHMQDVGLAVREIDFSAPPWISLQLDWKWTEAGCTNSSICRREDITDKATKTLPFIDLVLRGLFRYDYIPAGIRQYFGPLVFDITNFAQMSVTHIAPTWSRPIKTDVIKLDISGGGDRVGSSYILRSKSCYARTGVGPSSGPRDELYLIASGMIDLDLYRSGNVDDPNHLVPACGYLGSPVHPAPAMDPNPSQFPHLPHAGSTDSASLTSCEASGTFVGISFHENVFTHLISDIAASGIMCLAISNQGEGFFASLPIPIYTAGQFKMIMPELYSFLEDEFGSAVTDLPIIFVLKPKVNYGEVPGYPSVPRADFISDLTAWDPLPVTADVLLSLPNNDLEIWIDVDGKIEQWGYGPDDDTTGACSYTSQADATNWCSSFGSGTTPPAQVQIPKPPAGSSNDFINNFPDCVSFIDCDTTLGDPSDRGNERRFLGEFNVGITLGLDLNLYGCGRAKGKIFDVLSNSYGFSTTWYNPWNPSTAGNCTTVNHLRRIDLTLAMKSRVGSVDIYNDARGASVAPRVYYPFSNGTFQGYIADFVGVLLSGILALDAQVGYTLSAILDPNDDLYSSSPGSNRVIRIGGHAKTGAVFNRLTHTYIARDDIGNTNADPAASYQQAFLTIAIDIQGDIHPNFIYNIISGLVGGETTLFAPPFLNLPNGVDKTAVKIRKIQETIEKLKNGEEVYITGEKIRELVKRVEEGGYVIPRKRDNIPGVEDFPPETIVQEVSANSSRTVIKLSCVDDRTPSEKCWYSWRWPGKMWFQWSPSNEIVLKGLPDGVYEIEVRALDEMALPDITPEKVIFVVDDSSPSIFTPHKTTFGKREFMKVEVWDYITEPKDILISWKIESKDKVRGTENFQEDTWEKWEKPDSVENGRGQKFIRLPEKEGEYRIILRAKDKKGNVEEKTVYFRIEDMRKNSPIFSCMGE